MDIGALGNSSPLGAALVLNTAKPPAAATDTNAETANQAIANFVPATSKTESGSNNTPDDKPSVVIDLPTNLNFIKSQILSDKNDQPVYVSVNELTGDVVSEVPDDAVLRDQSYQLAASYQQTASVVQSDAQTINKIA
jgi:hypothetical protein